MAEVRRRWGDEETASEKVKKKMLEWLGHLAGCQTTECQNQPYLVGCPSPAPDVVQRRDGEI